MMPRAAVAGVLLLGVLAGACSNDGDSAETTTTPSTTSSTLAPEDALSARIDALLDIDPSTLPSVVDALVSMCDLLADVDRTVSNDDAENDSAASDAALIASTQETLIEPFASKFRPDVAAALLEETAEVACPDQARPINRYINDHLSG